MLTQPNWKYKKLFFFTSSLQTHISLECVDSMSREN